MIISLRTHFLSAYFNNMELTIMSLIPVHCNLAQQSPTATIPRDGRVTSVRTNSIQKRFAL